MCDESVDKFLRNEQIAALASVKELAKESEERIVNECPYEKEAEWAIQARQPIDFIDFNKPRAHKPTMAEHRPVCNSLGEKIDYISLSGPKLDELKSVKDEAYNIEYCKEDNNYRPFKRITTPDAPEFELSEKELLERWEKAQTTEIQINEMLKLEESCSSVVIADFAENMKCDKKKKAKKKSNELKGFLLFWVNVGQFSSINADAHVERMKERMMPVLDRIKDQNWEMIFLPTRSRPCGIERIEL